MTDLRKAAKELLHAYDRDWLPVGLPNHMKALRQALAHTSALAQPKQRMNERIQELAEQAGCKMMDDGEWYIPSAAGVEKVVYTPGVGLEKFAELIVRECAKRTGELGKPEIGQGLMKHFGVEE